MSTETNSSARIIIRPCGACRYLRKKCLDNCIFAPYFNSDQGTANFASIHKIFGASNVTKLLTNIPIDKRPEAVRTLNYEAYARLQDPIYGCVSQIFGLQNQVINLQRENAWLQAQVARQPPPLQPPQQPYQHQPHQQPPQYSLSMSDYPLVGGATYDMAPLFEFDPNIGSSQQQDSWAANQQPFHDDHNTFAGVPVGGGDGGGGEELLMRNQRGRKRSAPSMPPGTN
ncbi:LOB domain-containing protein 30-like [Impatiens glandulifera]|uniref:LOB domain-containing protein 30-like n=1 Tax=Impatiens glandulifera TaxID=253017 RepID=UPI001FB15A46|nr:LOB domain-containing protein 30-like [Impatiens glandulifera]